MDHILRPLRDPAWPIPILKDSSDVTLVGSDDKQNNAHKIILAWPDRSKKDWPATNKHLEDFSLEYKTKIRPKTAKRSDIRPWSSKSDHSPDTAGAAGPATEEGPKAS